MMERYHFVQCISFPTIQVSRHAKHHLYNCIWVQLGNKINVHVQTSLGEQMKKLLIGYSLGGKATVNIIVVSGPPPSSNFAPSSLIFGHYYIILHHHLIIAT